MGTGGRGGEEEGERRGKGGQEGGEGERSNARRGESREKVRQEKARKQIRQGNKCTNPVASHRPDVSTSTELST
eukprot:750342-Hanusia_phi.AAC.3